MKSEKLLTKHERLAIHFCMARAQTTIRFTAEESKALTELAEKFRCTTSDGTPSMRPLMRQIAAGFIVLSYAGSAPKSENPPGKKKHKDPRAFIFHRTSPPKWWDAYTTLDMLVMKTGVTSEQLEAVGFGVHGEFVTPPAGWDAWEALEDEPDNEFYIITEERPEWWNEDTQAEELMSRTGKTKEWLEGKGFNFTSAGITVPDALKAWRLNPALTQSLAELLD